MNELLKEFLIAIGGGATALIAVFTLFRSLFLTLFEKGINASFERNLEKYKNKLIRSTSAFEVLLEKELNFYSRIDPLYAELIVLIQDLVYYLKSECNLERKKQCEMFQEQYMRYCKLIMEMKNEFLSNESYITPDVFNQCTNLVKIMQDDLSFWESSKKELFNNNEENIDFDKAEEISKKILIQIALSRLEIKKRLIELSEI